MVGYLQGNSATLSAFRATCVNWKACADSNMQTLSPKALLPKDLIRLFPLLEVSGDAISPYTLRSPHMEPTC